MRDSIIQKKSMIKQKDFTGYIHDVGGPTANLDLYTPCKHQEKNGVCKTKQCLTPNPCHFI